MRPRLRPAPNLSIVVPCYNEEEALPETARRLDVLLEDMIAADLVGPLSHILFVDDGSRDRTWEFIEALHWRSARYKGVKLSRNRGHQHALLAGLMHASGDIVVSIDADLQDDLEVMKDMIRAHARGADIVLGVRSSRESDTAFKRFTAQGFYRFLRFMGVEAVNNHADYRLLSRRAIEALRDFGETNLFLRGLVMQLGFRTEIVYYARTARLAGESKYPIGKMIALALEGVTAFSTAPLRYITILGFAISIFSFMLGVWAFSVAVIFRNSVPGWASTVIPIYLICGVQMICLGIMGEYIGKIYVETKRRPRYIIETALPDQGAESKTAALDEGPAALSAARRGHGGPNLSI